jgi:hypothetical protein
MDVVQQHACQAVATRSGQGGHPANAASASGFDENA